MDADSRVDRRQKLTFLILTACVWVMNLVDGWSTHLLIKAGFAREGNPFMAYLYDISPKLFMFVKLVLMTAILVVMVARRWYLHKTIRVYMWILFGTYAALMAYHGWGWYLFLSLPK